MVDTEKLLHLGREILHRMVAVGKNVTIYPLDHPSVMDHASEMCELLKPLFAESQNVKFNIVANSEIRGGTTLDYSANAMRSVDLVYGVGYAGDIGNAERVPKEMLAQHERVLKDREPTIAVAEPANSSMNFAVRLRVKTTGHPDVLLDLAEAVGRRFAAEDICIPFPRRDVHLRQVT